MIPNLVDYWLDFSEFIKCAGVAVVFQVLMETTPSKTIQLTGQQSLKTKYVDKLCHFSVISRVI